MANIKSAKKRIKVINKKNMRNRMIRSSYRTALKRFEMAVAQGDKEAATELLGRTVSIVDKAAAKGAIHKNMANRKKAQLAKRIAAV